MKKGVCSTTSISIRYSNPNLHFAKVLLVPFLTLQRDEKLCQGPNLCISGLDVRDDCQWKGNLA